MNSSVYPRWRGEHAKYQYCANRPYRFIPAGAGNTCSRQYLTQISAVYPRWRGEHIRERLNKNIGRGLSPLARGTHKDASNPNS
ncbi:hypothetical protein ECSTECMHI813_2992 [Escherichia coli STEC_MHI813]|nr:hypothetical protein ECSTECMHI813_2992 [Escherichia coli STEC_MHI813]